MPSCVEKRFSTPSFLLWSRAIIPNIHTQLKTQAICDRVWDTCTVHTSDPSHSRIHKIWWKPCTGIKFTGMIEEWHSSIMPTSFNIIPNRCYESLKLKTKLQYPHYHNSCIHIIIIIIFTLSLICLMFVIKCIHLQCRVTDSYTSRLYNLCSIEDKGTSNLPLNLTLTWLFQSECLNTYTVDT